MANANAVKLYTWFRNDGLPHNSAVGFVGNLASESRCDPTIRQFGGGPGRGLAQWTVNQRWRDLTVWCRMHGLDPWSLRGQYEFIRYESKKMGVWGKLLLPMSTIDAAVLVMRRYEMPAVQTYANGVARALNGMRYLLGMAPYGGAPAPEVPVRVSKEEHVKIVHLQGTRRYAIWNGRQLVHIRNTEELAKLRKELARSDGELELNPTMAMYYFGPEIGA